MLALLLLCCAGVNMAMGQLVAFSAGLTQNANLRAGDLAVIYDRVFINEGNGYNPEDGHFTVPVAGLYEFHISALTQKGDELSLTIKRNDQKTVDIHASDPQDYSSASNSVILDLQVNDQIYVEPTQRSSLYAESDQIYATFSGFRLGDSNIPR